MATVLTVAGCGGVQMSEGVTRTPISVGTEGVVAPIARGISSSGGEVVLLELHTVELGAAEKQIDLVARKMAGIENEPWSPLWHGAGHPLPPMTDRIAMVERSDGRWFAATSFQKGTGGGADIWSGSSAALRGGNVQPTPVVHGVFDHFESSGQNAPSFDKVAQIRSLESLELCEWHGKVYMLGSGVADSQSSDDGRQYAWIAELPDENALASPGGPKPLKALVGCVIAEGVDPRIVIHDGGATLAVRAPLSPRDGEAPVRFFHTQDFITWTPDLDMWQYVRAFSNYSIMATSSSIWVATTTGLESPRLAAWRYDTVYRRWEERQRAVLRPEAFRVRSHKESTWLLSTDPDPRNSPVVYFVGSSGAIERASP